MAPTPPRLRLLAVALAGALVLAACSNLRSPAAQVNGEEITDDEVEASLPLYRFLSDLRQAPCGDAVAGETEEQACARFVLQNLIQEELVAAYAAEHGLAVPADDVTTAIDELREAVGGEEALAGRLGNSGLTEQDLRGLTERLLLFREVREDLAASAAPDEELRAQYEERLLEFTRIHAAHILLPTRKDAEDVAARATPENFAQLARELSLDPGSASQGGDLGVQPAAQFVGPFAEAAVALEPGEISGPVRTQFGWHLIHLIEEDVTPFEEARAGLLAGSEGQAFSDWIQDQLATAEIRVNPRYGRLDPATGEVEPITSTVPTEDTARAP